MTAQTTANFKPKVPRSNASGRRRTKAKKGGVKLRGVLVYNDLASDEGTLALGTSEALMRRLDLVRT